MTILMYCLLLLTLGVAQAQQDPVKLRISAQQGNKAALQGLRTLAGAGNASAQFELGVMYYTGEGVPKEAVQAVAWFRKAAEQGHADAQSNLGAMYARGEGVPKDLVIAYMWRNLAAAQGDEIGKSARDALEGSMTPAQIAEAQKLSREWTPKK